MIAGNVAHGEPVIDLAPVLAALSARGAGRLRHGPWSLLRHLRATYDLLTHWRPHPDIRLAGLCHSVYGTDEFAPRLFAADERDVVARLIGWDAERLVFLFCSLRRAEIAAAVSGVAAGASNPELSAAEAGALAMLAVANEAEQSRNVASGGPGLWLAAASRTARDARSLLDRVPAIFADCTATISAEDERRLRDAYLQGWVAASGGAGRADARHRDESLDVLVRQLPWVAEPFLLLALKALAGNRAAEAAAMLDAARPILDAWGTAWDKRLSAGQWRDIAAFVASVLRQPVEDQVFVGRRLADIAGAGITPQALYAYLRSIDALDVAVAPDVGGARETPTHVPALALGDPPPRIAGAELPARFAAYIAGFSANAERPLMRRYPGLTARTWHDPGAIPLARALEANATAIRAELLALDGSGYHAESEDIARHGRWDVLMLLERGRPNSDVLARCPAVASLLRQHGAVDGLGGLAYVSRLAPGTDIEPHRGPTNVRLRCHLGLVVPPACGLRVDGSERTWVEQRCLVFDDSFEHAAWNHGSSDRLVLIVDVWHPDLTVREIELLAGLHRFAHANAENLAEYWARNGDARVSGVSR
jgi:aspartate beta-hydroxylase